MAEEDDDNGINIKRDNDGMDDGNHGHCVSRGMNASSKCASSDTIIQQAAVFVNTI